jgi:hypothetical protein
VAFGGKVGQKIRLFLILPALSKKVRQKRAELYFLD